MIARSPPGAREMIVVIPDAFTKYSGSMFSNSPTTGFWETFVADDLTAYIDKRYRTIASRDGRGLAGHSMGGYGTMRIGMKQGHAFGALYAMSSCCLMNDPAAGRGGAAGRGDAADVALGALQGRGAGQGAPARGGGMANALSAQAAAWAPNPKNPPQFFDLPTQDGADPAARCRQVGRQLAAGLRRSVCAVAQVDACHRARCRRQGPVRHHQSSAR